MFRAALFLRSGATTAAASAAATTEAGERSFSFEKRLAELLENPECEINGGNEYAILQEKLTTYKSLMNEYAVKQSDLERAKRAANMCGLDFPRPKHRDDVETQTQENMKQ